MARYSEAPGVAAPKALQEKRTGLTDNADAIVESHYTTSASSQSPQSPRPWCDTIDWSHTAEA